MEASGIGSYLKTTRRRRRVGLQRAADATRIRREFLAEMESGRFDFQPPVYVRAFLHEYADYLRIDPGPLLEAFDREIGATGSIAEGILSIGRPPEGPLPSLLPRPTWTWLAAISGVVLAISVVLATGSPRDVDRTRVGPDEEAVAVDADVPETVAEPEPATAPVKTDVMTLTVVAARGPCWVRLTDRDGVVYTSPGSGLAPGERVGPFRVTEGMHLRIGDAAAVDLMLDGRAIQGLGAPGQVVDLQLPDDLPAAE